MGESSKMSGYDSEMISRANAMQQKFGNMTPAPNVFRMASGTQQQNNENIAFPVKLGSTDRDDKKYNIRSQLVSGPTGAEVPGVGMAVADDKFFEYADRKQQQQILYEFYNFMMAQADLSKPESAQWWYTHFPWMRKLRLDQIDKEADLQKTLARIQVTGPENEDDFMLLFLIRNGTISPPDYSVNKMGQQAPVATSYQEGFFSSLLNPLKAPWANPSWNFLGGNQNQIKVPWSNPTTDPIGYQNAGFTGLGGIPGTTRTDQWRNLLGLGGLNPPAVGRGGGGA